MVKRGIYNNWEEPGLRLWLQLRAFNKSKLWLRLQLRNLIRASASLWLRNLGLRTHVCLRDPCKTQVEHEIHLLVNTRTPRTSTNPTTQVPTLVEPVSAGSVSSPGLARCSGVNKQIDLGFCLFFTGPRGNQTARHKYRHSLVELVSQGSVTSRTR